MTGWQASIGRAPCERTEQIRIKAAAYHWPRAPDHALDDRDKQARHGNRREQKSDAHHNCRQNPLRERCQNWRQCGKRYEKQPEGPKKPARLAEVGDVIKSRNDPAWN